MVEVNIPVNIPWVGMIHIVKGKQVQAIVIFIEIFHLTAWNLACGIFLAQSVLINIPDLTKKFVIPA